MCARATWVKEMEIGMHSSPWETRKIFTARASATSSALHCAAIKSRITARRAIILFFVNCVTTSLSAAFGLVAFATFACSTVIVAVAHVVAAGVVSAETALQSGLGVALLGSLGFCVWCNKLRRLT